MRRNKPERIVNIARLFLFVAGAFFVLAGLAFLVAPVALSEPAQLGLASPVAILEVQGFYGGQMIGLGAFVLLGAMRSQLAVAALLLIAADLGGTAMGRAVGMATSGELPVVMLGLMVLESVTAVVSAVLIRHAHNHSLKEL